MHTLFSKVKIEIPEHIYLKNPETSELGKKIVQGGLDLIYELGFDQFNFRKLALKISTTEASIYRYFENKHKLLLYLTSWYWRWLDYKIALYTVNIEDPNQKLEKAILAITEKEMTLAENNDELDKSKLYNVIISEASKVYQTKDVDEINKVGAYSGYKQLVSQIAELIRQINPEFKYSRMLISTIIEGVNNQRFFEAHLPRLTDTYSNEDAVSKFYIKLVSNTIKKTK